MADIQLTAASRENLLQLNQTKALTERTQGRLSTGLRVSNVVDDAVAYFQAKGLNDRATDFTDKKSSIDQGISTLKVAMNVTDSVDGLLKQLKGLVQNARSGSTAERTQATADFKEIGRQISAMINDASYQGTNLLNATSTRLKVAFSEKSTAYLQISGFDLNRSIQSNRALFTGVNVFSGANGSVFTFSGVVTAAAGGFSGITQNSVFDYAVNALNKSITKLRSVSQSLGTNVAVLQTRLDFTKNYVNTLTEGAGKLTLADLNEEAANLVALQTRQQLGIQSLSVAGQQQQAILQLLR
jgi:flagellin